MNRKSARKAVPILVKVKPIPSPDFAFEKLQIAPRQRLFTNRDGKRKIQFSESKLSNEASTCVNCQKYRAEIKKLRSLKKVNESFFTPPVVVQDIGEDSVRFLIITVFVKGTMTPPMVKLPVIKMKSTKKNARRSNIWPFSKNSKTKTRRRRTVSTPDLGIREIANLRFPLKNH